MVYLGVRARDPQLKGHWVHEGVGGVEDDAGRDGWRGGHLEKKLRWSLWAVTAVAPFYERNASRDGSSEVCAERGFLF